MKKSECKKSTMVNKSAIQDYGSMLRNKKMKNSSQIPKKSVDSPGLRSKETSIVRSMVKT